MIKNAIWCFDDSIILLNSISQSREIYKMMRSDWSEWSRAAGAKPYLNLICSAEVFMSFFAEMLYIRYHAGVLTTTARSIDDMICLRTSFMHISKRAPCLKDLIWRYCWTVSPWAIGFDDNEKSLFEHRMNLNRSKTTCSRFCRIAYCLIEESKILLDVKMINFSS